MLFRQKNLDSSGRTASPTLLGDHLVRGDSRLKRAKVTSLGSYQTYVLCSVVGGLLFPTGGGGVYASFSSFQALSLEIFSVRPARSRGSIWREAGVSRQPKVSKNTPQISVKLPRHVLRRRVRSAPKAAVERDMAGSGTLERRDWTYWLPDWDWRWARKSGVKPRAWLRIKRSSGRTLGRKKKPRNRLRGSECAMVPGGRVRRYVRKREASW
jgi:hypothetical protein